MDVPRCSSSSYSLSLNSERDTLFHDENIAFSGVNIQNPLWDSGTSFSSSLHTRFEDYDDDLLLPTTGIFAIMKRVIPSRPPEPPPKSSWRSWVECLAKFAAVNAMICGFSVLVIFSVHQGRGDRGNLGVIVADDDAAVESQGTMISAPKHFACPGAMVGRDSTSYMESVSNYQNASLCEKEFFSHCECLSTLRPVFSAEEFQGDVDFPISEDLDVVLLGDTLIENCASGLVDTSMTDRSGMAAVCHQLFRNDSGRSVTGLALGASGDRIGHLLYRLQEDDGKIFKNLNPKIWWIQIGSNDIVEDHCSSESVAWATQLLVHAIKSKHPHAKIVLNSIMALQHDWSSSIGPTTRQYLNSANRLLKCLADDTDDFHFFDAGQIFSADGNISLEGMRAWGEAIVQKVLDMTT